MTIQMRVLSLAACVVATASVACDGSTGSRGPEGLQGPAGPQGPPGEASDGGARARLYGNGSDGALVVAAGETVFIPLESSGQYTSITIATGGTLAVGSGMLLRVTGDVDNDGTIRVAQAALSGVRRYGSQMVDLAPATAPAHPGIALGSAEFGSVDMTATFVAYGGQGGDGIGRNARWLTHLLPYGGGGGAGSWPFLSNRTESGGGSFHLRSGGEIRNAGTISAIGASGRATFEGGCGSGGGGGGVVLLAAATRIDNGGGVVAVYGGVGASSDGDQCGAGGGGGGGFVHLIAPSIEPGDVQVQGGAAGAEGAYGTLRWIGGSGGGGSAGSGGRGTGRIGAEVTTASGGSAGLSFEIVADPATVL